MRLAILFVVFFQTVCLSQTNWSAYNVWSSTKHGGSSQLDSKDDEVLNYSEIKGNCFFPKEWSPAIVILKSGVAVKLKKVRLNTYDYLIHYTDNEGNELIPSKPITKIIFLDKIDTTKISAFFESFISSEERSTAFFAQVLNEGKIQLLKRDRAELKTEKDPVTNEAQNFFSWHIDYFIYNHQNVIHLKNLNKNSILPLINPSQEVDQWLKSNKNKLKNEADVVTFLNFINNDSAKK